MTTKIQKWGNSQGIRLPKYLLEMLKWSENEQISVKAQENRIVIERVEYNRKKTINELFEGYDEEYVAEEIDWGKAEGKEVW